MKLFFLLSLSFLSLSLGFCEFDRLAHLVYWGYPFSLSSTELGNAVLGQGELLQHRDAVTMLKYRDKQLSGRFAFGYGKETYGGWNYRQLQNGNGAVQGSSMNFLQLSSI